MAKPRTIGKTYGKLQNGSMAKPPTDIVFCRTNFSKYLGGCEHYCHLFK